jgi:excisionase family DNA binding protein
MNETNETGHEPELLRVIEAAKVLALSRTKVYEMAERGEIPVTRIGSAVRIPRRKLLAWIDAQTISADLGGSQ